MISRIFVMPNVKDSREGLFLKSFTALSLKGKIKNVTLLDSYMVDSEFSKEQLVKISQILTNPILEKNSINQIPNISDFNYVIEVGFLPGVTDNVANTTKETILDYLHLDKNSNIKVYSSKVFLIKGTIKLEDVKKIAASLYNPLIERSYVANVSEIKKQNG